MIYLKTIIFIGTNKSGSSREATRAAEKMGFFTVLFTNNEKQLQQRRAYPDIHKMILVDTSKIEDMKDEIYKLTKSGLEIKTIVSFVDPYVHIASILCDEFCDNYTSSTAIEMMEDKEKTRNYLKNQSYSPKFFLIKPHESIPTNLEFPLIVKSPKSTGSKDVLLAKDSSQLNDHLRYLRNKNLGETIMIEEYIDGPQYLVEAIVYKRQPHVIGIVEQEITQGKRFIITGYGVLVKAPSDIQAGLEEVLQSIVTIFNIENGALHLELRLTKNGWKLIEINPRISGGAMNNMIFAAFGFNLVEETLKLLLGEPPNIQPRHKKFVYTKYVIVESKGILERVIGRTRASKSPGVVDVYVKPRRGTLLTPPLSMGHRYAYVIAEGTTLSEAKQNAVNAAREIKFILKVA
ncbi:ATP-grasp domain-containing protein [Lysinibacillus pakistanensis]|uniref:ATP-grasp domain-containing protein n=1 Tax=Lysinibacillus pakistanensis TaxID=759811 RepID=A0ABX6DCH2_9BACI|nr:ATP-grasp domain-containing protein [Lysinibacillus pakistanensis]